MLRSFLAGSYEMRTGGSVHTKKCSRDRIIETHRDEVQRLCRQFGAQSLDVFGSAASEAFDPQRSDIDFVVDFGPGAQPDLFNRYFGLIEALAAVFGRKVELGMPGGMGSTPTSSTRPTARASLLMHARSPKCLRTSATRRPSSAQ